MGILLEMTLSGAVLIAVIAIIRALAIHKLPKGTFMVLWCIALFQLIVPFSIPSQVSIFNLVGRNSSSQSYTAAIPLADAANLVLPQAHNNFPVAEAAANNSRLPAIEPLALVYLIGLAVFAIIFITLYIKNRKEFGAALPVSNAFITDWLEKHQLKRQISIRVSDKMAAPLTYGILRPVILLPKDTDWRSESELNYILTHEFVHIKRFDALIKLVMAVALCMHWFNPLAWVMYILFSRDMEISCDEAVIRRLGETSKQGYALTLISMAGRKNHLPALCSNFSKYAIEERITAIMKMKKGTIIGTIAALLVVGMTVTVFATSSPDEVEVVPEYQPSAEASVVEDDIDEDLQYVPEENDEAFIEEPADDYIAEDWYTTTVIWGDREIGSSSPAQFLWPVSGEMRITSPFGLRIDPISGREEYHAGMDIAAPEGTPIVAVRDGVVTFSGWQEGYGNTVIIDHGDGHSTIYAHNSRNLVLADQSVRMGQHIADVGSTGMSKGPHLHFEMRIDDVAVDPLAFFAAD
ncbi:MAG: M23/M56 family metallopeptidase [Defluviitaleaceae bacterium]|nr:M23/M56 family metallopeptidase [Defluviitaleaceae bacterium]